MRISKAALFLGGIFVVAAAVFFFIYFDIIERIEINNPEPSDREKRLNDDELDKSRAPVFDPDLVSDHTVLSRSSGVNDVWQINFSGTVFKLDMVPVRPDREPHLEQLHPSYCDVLNPGVPILPSVNLINGKGKQFDDGLYAALDLAHYEGLESVLDSHIRLVERLGSLTDHPKAKAYITSGLSYACRPGLPGAEPSLVAGYKKVFESGHLSKPISFYTWTERLSELFRFMRFFMQPIMDEDLGLELCRTLLSDDELRRDYEASITFYEDLTNPRHAFGLDNIYGNKELVWHSDGRRFPSFWPPSTSREVVLFEALFSGSPVPPEFRLMEAFIDKIKSGEINLEPGEEDGWYQYQAYALQSFLLPTEGLPSQKLLLMKKYKIRLEEAFSVIITKHRETHARQLAVGEAGAMMPRTPVKPMLRVEPNPLFYLRSARAYSFLRTFLLARMGAESLRGLHGLTENGKREMNLLDELEWFVEFFYGCYLVCCDDIGLEPDLMPDELAASKMNSAKNIALEWFADMKHDPDLAVDTRVAIPIMRNPDKSMKIWATIGVRLSKLKVEFERGYGPMIRAGGEWVPPHSLSDQTYYLPVDAFVEVFNPVGWYPNRDELRSICDEKQNKEDIIEALESRR